MEIEYGNKEERCYRARTHKDSTATFFFYISFNKEKGVYESHNTMGDQVVGEPGENFLSVEKRFLEYIEKFHGLNYVLISSKKVIRGRHDDWLV